jgi:sentrin-specific protease 1
MQAMSHINSADEEEIKVLDTPSRGHPRDQDPVVAQWGNYQLTESQAQTMQSPRGWFSDNMVNITMEYIRQCANQKGQNVWIPNCFFLYSLLYNNMEGYLFENVRRWTKRANVDIFTLHRIIVPTNVGKHWVCFCIDLRRRTICVYDSLPHGQRSQKMYQRQLEALRKWVVDEFKAQSVRQTCEKHQAVRYPRITETSPWKYIGAPFYVPRQRNGSDCGIFACCYAFHLTFNMEMNFGSENMQDEREGLVSILCRHQ